MNILSIQSWVSYGHVGNASAIFPLQRLGAEVWAINTVQFSNHTGYGDWTGAVYSGQSVRELVDGIAARGALERCDAVLTGYVGGADIGDAILHAVTSVRRAKPEALYCCDPVIGDSDTGVYVRPGIEAFLRDAGSAGRRYRDAEPVRDRAADRARLLDLARCQAGGATAAVDVARGTDRRACC